MTVRPPKTPTFLFVKQRITGQRKNEEVGTALMTLMYESADYTKKNCLFQKVKFKMVAAIKFIFSFRFGDDTE